MSLDLFFTQPTQASTQTGSLSAALGVESANKGEIFDQIISSLREALKQNSEQEQATNAHKQETGLLQSDNPALSENSHLDVATLLAANKDVKETLEENIETFALNVQAQISEALALNKQTFDQDLNLSNVKLVIAKFPENKKAEIASFLQGPLVEQSNEELGRFEALLNKIERLISEDSSVLLVTNLTPEQITELKMRINEKLSRQEGTEEASQNVPATNIIVNELSKDSITTNDRTYNASGNKQENLDKIDGILSNIFIGLINLSAPQNHTKLNGSEKITTNTGAPLTLSQASGITTPLQSDNSDMELLQDLDLKKKDFREELKSAEKLTKYAPLTKAQQETTHATAQINNSNSNHLRGYLNANTGSISSPLNDVLNGLGIPTEGLQITGPTPLSNLSTQAQSASHAHPATQAIIATLQKGTAGGKNTVITLQLDPEELGKVEVRLEFTKNQNIKAHMLIEKPETHLMMQRDAHLLERALQETGLDTDAEITFDLANEGHDFGQNGGHDDHNNPNAKGRDNNEDETIEEISTTMSWYVDPNTGMTRYDFLA